MIGEKTDNLGCKKDLGCAVDQFLQRYADLSETIGGVPSKEAREKLVNHVVSSNCAAVCQGFLATTSLTETATLDFARWAIAAETKDADGQKRVLDIYGGEALGLVEAAREGFLKGLKQGMAESYARLIVLYLLWVTPGFWDEQRQFFLERLNTLFFLTRPDVGSYSPDVAYDAGFAADDAAAQMWAAFAVADRPGFEALYASSPAGSFTARWRPPGPSSLPNPVPQQRVTPVSPPPPLAAATPKSKVAAGLLGIFLGGFGVHKFYLGFPVAGVIMLAVSVIGGFITSGFTSLAVTLIGLVEGIIYLTKSDADFHRIYAVDKKQWF
jgi:TM2 domain-containing membrane protein YozV